MAKPTGTKTESTKKNGGCVRSCTCSNPGQDNLHGKGNRVFSRCAKGWRCTVCSKVVTVD